QSLKVFITDGEAWDLAHLMAQTFSYEGVPERHMPHEVELPLFSSMEFERDEEKQPSITLLVGQGKVEWIYEELDLVAGGAFDSVEAFFKEFGLKAGAGEYTEKFSGFMFTKAQVAQLQEWKSQDHPYLDDDVALRDYLFLLLLENLCLDTQPEPYNTIIFDWLKL
ncbi:MAG: hypothetical protein ACN6OP_30295, partial [Pseudomonadales bacterium]